jgi:hypothetical protein
VKLGSTVDIIFVTFIVLCAKIKRAGFAIRFKLSEQMSLRTDKHFLAFYDKYGRYCCLKHSRRVEKKKHKNLFSVLVLKCIEPRLKLKIPMSVQ